MSALSVSAMAALGSILSIFVRTNEMRSFFWSMTFGDWKKNLANGKKKLPKFSTVIWQNSAQLFDKIQQFQSW